MINGHGDDAYHYEGITSDFSSNICAHTTHQHLMAHLAACPGLLDHYPEPEAWSLERLIAAREGIDPACVVTTSGATEAIYIIAACCAAQHFDRAVIPTPTFSEYADACHLSGIRVETSQLHHMPDTDLRHGAVLWLCNPNNPTGTVYDQLLIDRLSAACDLVVLDQSYENYTAAHVMSARWACRYDNVIQLHSMTKAYGVPGLRLGYITANVRLTEKLRRFMRPWSVSALAVEAGKYLLAHDDLICRPDLGEARRLRDALCGVPGISVEPTQTNFMLCRFERGSAASLKECLARRHHILIRDASNFQRLTLSHFRIAAQTPAENDALMAAVREETEAAYLPDA